MRISVTVVATDTSFPVALLARAVEDRGLHGMWLPDHTHIPICRTSPYPLGGDLPARYTRILDPFVALGAAAAVTSTLRLGTGILLVAQREPIATAKALATLDHLSGGRLRVGIGYGWNIEEMVDHGVDPASRRRRTREHALAMRCLWEDEAASFAGEHVTLSPSWQWPKPRQRPLPVFVGGAANETTFKHIAEFGHGWIPMGARGLRDGIVRLHELVADAGRDPADIEIVPFTADASHAKLDHFEAAGVRECAFELPSGPADLVLPVLDALASLSAERSLP